MRSHAEISQKIHTLEMEYQKGHKDKHTNSHTVAVLGQQIALLLWVCGESYTRYRNIMNEGMKDITKEATK